MEFLLDSVILIDHFNNVPQATAYLGEVRGNAAISAISRGEILTGFDARSGMLAARLLDCFPILGISKPIADQAANLRYEYGWGLANALQAALAQHHHLKLATRMLKPYSPIQHDFIIVPYVL